MSTQLRDWYLSTLGVVVYRSRDSAMLAGQFAGTSIAEHTVLGAQSPDDAGQYSEATAPVKPVIHPGKGRLADQLLSAVGDGDDARTSQKEQPELQGSEGGVTMPAREAAIADAAGTAREKPLPDGDAEAVAFSLACWRADPDMLVLCDWNPEGASQVERIQLLSNILRAIDRLPGPLAEPEILRWPVGQERGWGAAREHVEMFLAGRRHSETFDWVLALGSDACNVLGTSNAVSVEAASPEKLSCGAQAILTHGLDAMLGAPGLKKDVWTHIRFLCSPQAQP